MTIRLAAIQPMAGTGRAEERNATDALDWLDKAAASGADLVLFPEGHPGPTNPQNHFDAFGPLAERAARLGVHVVAGRIEPVEDGDGYYVVLHLIDDEGATVGLYRRTTPAGPYDRAGMIAADLDLDRLAFLRAEDEKIESPRRYRTVPGLLRWRRPEVIEQLTTAGS